MGSFLACTVCVSMSVGGTLGKVQILEGSELSFRAFLSRRNSLTQIAFVESCVDFEVTHFSIIMVWRLLYRSILHLITCCVSELH